MLDSLEPVLREEWPKIKAPRVKEILRTNYGHEGSVDLAKSACHRLRPRRARPAQRTVYRPGHVLRLDWAELPTRQKIAGRQRPRLRVDCELAVRGRADGALSFDLSGE